MSDQTGTVVVIEDDPHIADLVDLYLRKDGFRVLLARDGDEGLALISREPPVFVILDVGLPGGKNGFDICREIRSKDNIPVLFLTARDDEVDRILGLELGADDYLVKPFSPRPGSGPSFAGPGKPPASRTTCRSVTWRSTSGAGKCSVPERWWP
jgi:CheY-like chemotaxis protein